jgi:2',3'-cyclic-nucleotide 2'-phosphodiesterase (5'-nucleotidase family)
MAVRILHYSDLENVYDTPEQAGRLATVLRERDGALAAGSGDNTAPGVLSLVTEGRQALDLYDAVDPDVETLGNHDFDYGAEATADVVSRSPQTWVSANVHRNGSRACGVAPWTILETGGAQVGFVGVLDDDTPSLNPMASDLTVTDPVVAVQEAAAELRDAGADYVVALSHLGRGDEELAVSTDVDAILGGHVASERIERVDGTLLTRPGSGGEVVLDVDLESGDVTRREVAEEAVYEPLAERLRERMARTGLNEVVGHVSEPMERTEATLFRGESRIGNFVADAYRWAADADVGLQNSGGVRDGPDVAGDVTVADLVSVVPFEEPVGVAELSGDELLEVFRASKGGSLGFAEPEWWHAHVSGAQLEWDESTDELVAARVDGEPVRPDRTYTVATTDYLFYTDDEFPALDESHRVERLDVQHEVLAAYAREHGIEPAVEGRVTLHGAKKR